MTALAPIAGPFTARSVSEACRRSMVAPTPAGVPPRVAIETATITVKASGAVQAADPADGPGRLGSAAPAVISEPPGTRTSSLQREAQNRARGS